MKLGNGWERKLRRGSASLGLCVLVLVAVLLLNVGMTALCTSQFWFIDLTPKSTYTVYQQHANLKKKCGMYSLMDETVGYLEYIFEQANKEREEPVEVEIIFCAEPDQLIKTDSMRYVYYTALGLQKQFLGVTEPDEVDVFHGRLRGRFFEKRTEILRCQTRQRCQFAKGDRLRERAFDMREYRSKFVGKAHHGRCLTDRAKTRKFGEQGIGQRRAGKPFCRGRNAGHGIKIFQSPCQHLRTCHVVDRRGLGFQYVADKGLDLRAREHDQIHLPSGFKCAIFVRLVRKKKHAAPLVDDEIFVILQGQLTAAATALQPLKVRITVGAFDMLLLVIRTHDRVIIG